MSALEPRLVRLEELLRERHPDLVAEFRPGLTDAELDQVLAPLPFHVPEELREWWRWHDGIDGPSYITSGLQFVQARTAVEASLEQGEILRDANGDVEIPPDVIARGWPDAQLMVFCGPGTDYFGADCSQRRDSVMLRAYSQWSREYPLVARSLADAVSRICDHIEQNDQRWEPGATHWTDDGSEEFPAIEEDS